MCCGSALAFAQGSTTAPAPEGAPPADAPGSTAAPTGITSDIERRLEEIDQRTRITERKLELAQQAAAQKPPQPSLAAAESGFGITSPDKFFDVRLHALLQIDARRTFFSDDALLRDKVDTFLLRRVRPILDATLIGLVDLRITPDFGGGTTAIYDAYADIHPTPWLRFRAGKFKPPIGLERLQTDTWVPFIERSMDSNLSSQRDIGLEIWGDVANAAVHYELAILNGTPDGSIVDVDNEHAKTYAGRLFLRPFQFGESSREFGDLGFGVAVETGNEKGSNAASNTWLPTFKSPGQQTIYTYVSSATDLNVTAFASHHHTRWNPQLYYYVGPFGLLAEYVHEYQQLGKGSSFDAGAVNNKAGHVTASWVLGGVETYDGPKQVKPVNWATKDLGALEIAARFGWLDLDDLGFVSSAFADPSKSISGAKNWGLAVNWWLLRGTKIAATWEQTTFTGGAGTTKAVADRATEKVGFARVQVAF
ncbi:MAG TPA: porin [Polyangia bacterium]|nr:porin [Polyangia bacterium]